MAPPLPPNTNEISGQQDRNNYGHMLALTNEFNQSRGHIGNVDHTRQLDSYITIPSQQQQQLLLQQATPGNGLQYSNLEDSSLGTNSLISVEQQKKDIEKIVMVCNDVDQENESDGIMCVVCKCVKEEIWPDTKFMTVNVIKQTRCDKYPGSENSVLGKLLHRTMLTNYDYSERLKFWRKYGNVVRKQLNKLKTNYGRGLKEELLNSKLLFEYC